MERAYKASALAARALNALSLLAYQAELRQDFNWTRDQVAWDESPIIIDICRQATGKVMGTLVLQEHAPGEQEAQLGKALG